MPKNYSKPKVTSKVIGVCGMSGSGKSYLTYRLKERFERDLSIVSMDDYYKPLHMQVKDSNGKVNFDLPTAIDSKKLVSDVVKLLNNKSFELEKYTFNKVEDTKEIVLVKPARIILVEGIFLLAIQELQELLHHTFFVDSREDIVLKKRISRDIKERGMLLEDVLYQWKNHVLPAYDKYVLPYKPMVDTSVFNNHQEDLFVQEVEKVLTDLV